WNFRKNTVLRASGGEFFAETAGHNLKNVFSGAGEATTSCKAPVATAGNCVASGIAGSGTTALQFPQLLFNQNLDVPPGTLTLPGLPAAQQPSTLAPGGVATVPP